MHIIAESTFLNVSASAWSAWGVWATIAIYLVLARAALNQLAEARRLRRAQTRPFVIVDLEFRSLLIDVAIRNIGPTAATQVKVEFDQTVESSFGDAEWQFSKPFTTGLSAMAPGRVIRYTLDNYRLFRFGWGVSLA